MFLYNTLSNQKELFIPLKDKTVKMYTCGPTVYDYAHIGNFRSYLCADFLRRALEYLDYKVIQVKNITDVGHLTQDDVDEGEDKIEKSARQQKITPQQIARFYEKAFLEDEKKLNIEVAAYYPRATDNIQEMISAVKQLLKKRYAYQSEGAVFFEISKFPKYGKLSGNTLDKLMRECRIEHVAKKRNSFDFYLWRPATQSHLMHWPSPWSEGYPGWHIECSVMSRKYLKTDTLDIHSGGEDNIFPHHENEIAQSEALTGKKFVNYWFHPRYLLVEGRKMAKSKGNFYTLKDLENKKYSPLSFRLLVFSAHYRSPLDFSFKALDQAKTNLKSIKEFVKKLAFYENSSHGISTDLKELIYNTRLAFRESIEDDLNTPKTLAIILSFIKQINTLIAENKIDKKQAKEIYNLMIVFDKVLGLDLATKLVKIPDQIKKLAEQRKILREQNKFKEADEIRKQIEKKGYEVNDMGEGFILRKMTEF